MNASYIPRLPIGTSDFVALKDFGQIYVDKTAAIYTLASRRQKFFLARPRRFGKSLLVSTLKSLFENGLRDFAGLAIERLWNEARTYKVVHLDFSAIKNFQSVEEFKFLLPQVLDSAFSQAGFQFDSASEKTFYVQFSDWLRQLSANSIVLLVDEYDAPLTVCLNDKEVFDRVRRELSNFYAQLKINDGAFRFLLITGITKFNKTSLFSELNNLVDITYDPRFADLLGYTHEEVLRYFSSYLTQASRELGVSEENLLKKLTLHYDGFCFDSMAQKRVFAPWSLLNFLDNPVMGFRNYWFESGGRPSALMKFLQSHSLRNPLEYGQDHTVSFSELMNSSDPETLSDVGLLTQTGYLTIKASDDLSAVVNYPNVEVRNSMAQLYSEELLRGANLMKIGVDRVAYRFSKENPESIFHILQSIFASVDYKNYPVENEAALRAFVQIFLEGSGLSPQIEVHNHRGRSDLEVVAGARRWIFEFKVSRASDSADDKLIEGLEQIAKYGDQYPTDIECIRMVLVFSLEKRAFIRWKAL